MNDILLEINNLHANVEGKEILKGLDLTIRRGEVHAVMGPNGAGKSTILNLVIGFHMPEKVLSARFLPGGRDMRLLKVLSLMTERICSP